MRRFPVTIGDDDTRSRVPDPPERSHRRLHPTVAIVEYRRPGLAAPRGPGGFIAGGESEGGTAAAPATDCQDCV